MNGKKISSHSDYQLLDCGNLKRLEQVGNYKIIRNALQAEWKVANPNIWHNPDAIFNNIGKHNGVWNKSHIFPNEWKIKFDSITTELRLTASGQIGIFPEQISNWMWLKDIINTANRPLKILNGFAYTGMASIFAASSGIDTKVCHLDSSKSAVNWAKKNASLNNLSNNSIRWMTEDVLKYMQREINRGKKYDGIILDPPAFGRGPKGEKWKLTSDIKKLMNITKQLLSKNPLFVLLSCHAPEITTKDLEHYLKELNLKETFIIESGELNIPSENKNSLPAGIFAKIY